MFGLFKFDDIDQFAKQLANEFGQRMPVKVLLQQNRKVSPERVALIIDTVIKKATEFSKLQRLGWLAKARLGMTFKWELKAAGYPEDMADILTKSVVIHIAGKQASPPVEDAKKGSK